MPTMRFLPLITGRRRIFFISISRAASSSSCLSRQNTMPADITSQAVAVLASSPAAMQRQTMSLSVTMPISRSFSPIGMAPISCSRINVASSVTGVSGLTQSTPLCITSLTFMTDLRCWTLRALDEIQPQFPPRVGLYNGSSSVGRPPAHHEPSLKVISSKARPAGDGCPAAFEFPAINEIAAMPKKDRQQRAHELATQVHIAAIAGLELLSMDKAKLIARVQNRYEFFGPMADARQS